MKHWASGKTQRNVKYLLAGLSSLAVAACGGGGSGSGPAKSHAVFTPSPTTTAAPTIILEPENAANPDSWRGREYDNSTGFDLINAAEAYASRTTGLPGGQGVKIAILDEGIDGEHPDLKGAVTYTATLQPAHELGGHGTFVAGVAGARRHGNAGDPKNRMGVAYAADLIDLRVSKPGFDNGEPVSHYDFAVVAAAVASVAGVEASYSDDRATYSSDLKAEADIMNLSFGGFVRDEANRVRDAMRLAAAEDKIIVAAAGNQSSANPIFEASLMADPEVAGLGIAVVGVDVNGNFTDFSNQCGVTMHYCMAAVAKDINSTTVGGGHATGFGTSHAAPMVAGAAAVLKAAFPGVSSREIVQRLFKSGSNADTGPTPKMGWGILDLNKAMNPMGSVGIAQGRKATGSRLSLEDTKLSGSAVTGNLLANSELAAKAVVFDDMGFPFYADLDQYATVSQPSSMLASVVGHGQARSVTSGYSGGMQYRMSLQQNQLGFTGSDTVIVSGSLTAPIADSMWITANFAENAAFTQAPITGSPSSMSATEAARPFAAMLGRADGLTIEVALPFGGEMAVSHHQSTGRGDVVLNADTVNQQFYHQENTVQSAKKLTAVSYGTSISSAVSFTATAGRMEEVTSVLGSESTGAFSGNGGSVTDYVEFAVGAQFLGFNLFSSYTTGRTDVAATALTTGMDKVQTEAYSLSAARRSLFKRGDSLSFSWSKPLNVSNGSFDLTLPVGREEDGSVLYETETVQFSGYGLTVLEANYGVGVGDAMSLSFSAFRRAAADKSVYEEIGAGVRFSKSF